MFYCRQRIEPRAQLACAENFVKFGNVFEICERTDNTYRDANHNSLQSSWNKAIKQHCTCHLHGMQAAIRNFVFINLRSNY